MFKAIGLSKKSKPASEESISKHRGEQALRDQWRGDTQKAQAIIAKLSQAYEDHKGAFALSRYEGLKNMIKEAIREFKLVVEANKARATEKYEAKSRGPPSGGVGAVSRLKNTAAEFMHNDERQKNYHDMTAKEVDEDLTRFRREVLQYKKDFREARDCLEKLSKSYEDSKQFSPPQRYNELKVMIKDITRSKPTAEATAQATK